MKKIYLSLLLALAGLVSSCDMDKEPYGALNKDKAIQDMKDIGRLRGGVYTALRSMTTGGWVYFQDLQMDEFHGMINNENRNGLISSGSVNSSTPEFETFWANVYSVIGSANYLLEKCDDLMQDPAIPADSLPRLEQYKADACFLRAYSYFWLAVHYCQPYAADKAEQAHLGLPIVTTYNPTGDPKSYPARSTMSETYKLIEDDLVAAYDGFKSVESKGMLKIKPMSEYLNSNAVLALQARVALYKGEYAVALAKAKQVIDSKAYALTSISDVTKLWASDLSNEIIFRPFQSTQELGSSTASPYVSGQTNSAADYIPTYATLAVFGEGDVRFDAYFAQWQLNIENKKYDAYVFNKYPGNDVLRLTQSKNYMNMSKPFRLSELYLIAAESAAMIGNTTDANQYLNDLSAQRINNYTPSSSTGSTLLNNIKAERQKELMGEGFRFFDLKRWHEGFVRYASHDENPELDGVIVNSTRTVAYAVNDYRYTWPIPKAELDANPQIKGQQNPGY